MTYESYPMHLLYDGKSTLWEKKAVGFTALWEFIKVQSAFLSLHLNSTLLQ